MPPSTETVPAMRAAWVPPLLIAVTPLLGMDVVSAPRMLNTEPGSSNSTAPVEYCT